MKIKLCQHCNTDYTAKTKDYNSKYCSRTCSAIVNNQKFKKRKPEGNCLLCNIPTHKKNKYCIGCSTNRKEEISKLAVEKKRRNLPIPDGGEEYKGLIRGIKSGSQAVADWRRRTKLKAVEYKGGCCVKCGYNKSMRALIFHHLDPDKKSFAISQAGITRRWELIKEELDKCELLCANCHAETHD